MAEYREATEKDWRDMFEREKRRAEQLQRDNGALRDALRRLRDSINYTLETGRA